MSNTVDKLSEKIIHIGEELKNLKTAHVKTATTLATTAKETRLSFSLVLHSWGGLYSEIFSSKRAHVTLTTTDGTDMMSELYLKGVTPANINRRNIFVRRCAGSAHNALYEVWVYSQNPDDYDVLSGGGTINLEYTVQGVGTSNFNISVRYEDTV